MTINQSEIYIVPAAKEHEADWRTLWDLYCGDKLPAHITDHTWQRIIDPSAPINALMAVSDRKVVAFLIWVEHEGTWETKPLCYIEDLYVDKFFRGRELDIGHKMIARLLDDLATGRWSRLYGLTSANNHTAQKLYDRFTNGESFVRYIVKK